MDTERSTSGLQDLDRRVDVLTALADPARLRVVDALVLGDASPGELAERLGLRSNLLAHHLGVLERQGLVTRHRSQADRRRSYLRLVPGSLADLLPGHSDVGTGVLTPARVVFVCTANSARSVLASALWSRNSAVPSTAGGTSPAPALSPGTAAVAQRHQLPLPQTSPQLVPDLTARDVVVTVCDNAFEELAPIGALDAPAHRLHWSVPDPVPAGDEQAFEDAYADIEGRVITLARHLDPTPTAPARQPA